MSFFRQFPRAQYDILGNGVKYAIQDFTRFVSVPSTELDNLSIYQYYEIPDGARPDVVSSLLYSNPDYHWTFFLINDHLKRGYSEWPMSQHEFESYIDQEYDGVALRMSATIEGEEMFEIGNTLTTVEGASGVVHARDEQNSQVILKSVTGEFSAGDTLISADPPSNWIYVAVVSPYREGVHHWITEDGEEYNGLTVALGGIVGASPVSFLDWETTQNDTRRQIRVVRPEYVYEFATRYRKILNA